MDCPGACGWVKKVRKVKLTITLLWFSLVQLFPAMVTDYVIMDKAQDLIKSSSDALILNKFSLHGYSTVVINSVHMCTNHVTVL
jgi:hypothetical protein